MSQLITRGDIRRSAKRTESGALVLENYAAAQHLHDHEHFSAYCIADRGREVDSDCHARYFPVAYVLGIGGDMVFFEIDNLSVTTVGTR